MTHAAISLAVGVGHERKPRDSASSPRVRVAPAVLGDTRPPAAGVLLAGTF
jgi:hypothetical protein